MEQRITQYLDQMNIEIYQGDQIFDVLNKPHFDKLKISNLKSKSLGFTLSPDI